MGAFADSLFTVLLGWVRGLVSAIFTLFSSGGESGFLTFLGKNWLVIVLAILAIGLVGDWFIWMVRWQPYRVWGTNMRRIARALHITREQETPEEEEPSYAPAQEEAWGGTRVYQRAEEPEMEEENIDFAQEAEFDLPPLTQEDEDDAYAAAQSTPDAQEYPGMHYDVSAYMRPAQEEVYEEETVYEEPAYEETAQEEPTYEEPVYEEAAYEDVVYEPHAAYDESQADVPEEDDVEFAQEIDPLASYDDPQVLAQLTISAQEANNVQMAELQEAEASAGEETTSRRRRRRRSEMGTD